jgi:hypothetical protein
MRVDRWAVRVNLPGRVAYLGTFDTKEEAAAAHDRTARLHLGQRDALCNYYATQMDAKDAIREASEISVLINDGRMELIGERYGEAKQQEAYQFIVEMLRGIRRKKERRKQKGRS